MPIDRPLTAARVANQCMHDAVPTLRDDFRPPAWPAGLAARVSTLHRCFRGEELHPPRGAES
eukprot:8315024-Alexandrium_andersonii.AAC.1